MKKESTRPSDRWLTGTTLFLSFFGLLMVYDSSVAIALRDFSDQYYFLREQTRWLAVGIIVMGVVSRIDYRTWGRIAVPLLFLTLLLLVLVFVPGLGVKALGAHRWISLGFFVFQPAELAKLILTIYLSVWFATKEKGRTFAFLLLLAMTVGLDMLEPDLGTAVVIVGIAMVLYFLSGTPLWHFGLLVPVVALALGAFALSSPYRLARITTFLNPERDPLGASYQIRQILLGLGSGGWFGIGIGKSRQKYEYLPEANTDSIFAIIAEEVGFVGSLSVMALFLFLIWRGFRIAKRAPDTFGKLLASGIAGWLGIQTVINLGANVALVPLTGVPLPLISYGGSSLIMTLTAIGILLNISKHRV